MSSTILGTALPAFVAHAASTTLYVNNGASANCSDSGSGSETQPFCTVQAAANAAQPGQTVLIAPNTTYSEQVTVKNSGSSGSPITFKGAGATSAYDVTSQVGVPTGAGNYAGRTHAFAFSSGVHDVVVTGLRLVSTQEAALVTDADHVVLDGNAFRGAGTGAPLAPAIRLTGKTTASTVSRNIITGSGTSDIVVDGGVAGSVLTTNLMSADHGGIVATDAPGTVVTSNSVLAFCSGAITLAGASANSTVENNAIGDHDKSSCLSQPDLAVSAGSVSGTKVDYNVLPASASGGASYGWGADTAASQAEFTQKSGGQGAHDLTPASVNLFSTSAWEATDSADANAPGELATDVHGNARVDDPQVANTGTGAGYYDRGAIELQDPLQPGVSTYPTPDSPHPLDASIDTWIVSGWGPVTATLDFGDGSPKVSVGSDSAIVSHTYPDSGTYTVTITATDGTVTKTRTATVIIQPVGPLGPVFHMYQSNYADPQVTFSVSAVSPWPVAKYTMDFGDGSPQVELTGPGVAPASHTYPGAGRYSVTETVTDDHGRAASTSQTVDVRDLPPLNRTMEVLRGGTLSEYYSYGNSPNWYGGPVGDVPYQASAISFSYSPSGARVIEGVENGQLHEIYSAADGWHDGVVAGAGGNITALGFSYSPSGARVIEAIENGQLHEIYSAADGWHDGVVAGAGNASALGFSYSPSGARVIEAIENGQLHEIYSAADGWHDSAIGGVGGNVSALSFSYSQSGDRVIEAIESSTLHEIYTDAGGWHDNAVVGVGSVGNNITALSFKLTPTGDRVIEAVESNMLHEIYTSAGSWWDTTAPFDDPRATAVSLWLR